MEPTQDNLEGESEPDLGHSGFVGDRGFFWDKERSTKPDVVGFRELTYASEATRGTLVKTTLLPPAGTF